MKMIITFLHLLLIYAVAFIMATVLIPFYVVIAVINSVDWDKIKKVYSLLFMENK
jgi:hypothetical protein